MKKQNVNAMSEAQVLDLLKKVLPKTTPDVNLAGKIYQAVENELKQKAKVKAFEKFCSKVELPDLEPKSIMAVKQQLSESFGEADITVKANKKEKNLTVEVALPDGGQLTSEIQVRPVAEGGEEDGVEVKFAPFPVCMPGDKELVWFLAKPETMTPEEACIKLSRVEEDFWASKTGQKLLRDRVERCFPEFISRVPSAILTECGLKRHYKAPEALKSLVLEPVAAGRKPGKAGKQE